MIRNRRFPPGRTYPNEEFIQWAIEQHFAQSFAIQPGTVNTGPDLRCHDKTTKALVWWIEAKGLTAAPSVDFQSVIGQLLIRMDSADLNYGAALPDHNELQRFCRMVKPRVRQALALHWILVDQSGAVRIVDHTGTV